MVKAVLFDFWGTLVDTGVASPIKQTYTILRPNMPMSQFVPLMEKTIMTREYADQAVAFSDLLRAFNTYPKKFLIDKLVGAWNSCMLLSKPYDDTVESLKDLRKKKIKVILISNTPSFVTKQVIEKFELDQFFDEMFFSYELGLLKNDPEFFNVILKKIKVKKDDALVVGDSIETDIEGAKSAGIKAVLIDRRNTRQYDPKISSLKELDKYL